MFDVSQRGDIAVLQMSYGKANAIDLEFCRGIEEQLEEIRKSSAKALVLTGEGNIFSAGLNLVRVLEEGSEYRQALVPALSTAFEKLFFFPKPVVVAVNGHAIAGGCLMACTGDHRIMSKGRGRIGIPELLVGVPFPTSALEMMRFVTDSRRLQVLMFGGATYLPEDAVEMGLVDELVEASELMDAAVEKAERLSSLAPQAFAASKRQIRQPVLDLIREGQSKFEKSILDIWGDSETLDSIRNYVSQTLNK